MINNSRKKFNALLVYPKIPPTYWSFIYALFLIGVKAAIPPLGLLTIAAFFSRKWNLKVIDMNVEDLTDEDIEWADYVFISGMIIQKESFHEVINRCNKMGKPITAGGPYPTSSHVKIKGVSHFVLGEAENVLPQLLNDLLVGRAKEIYQSDCKPAMGKLPPPRYDLINLENYGSMALQYSRGCPFSCEFCDIIEMFGRKPRAKTSGQVLEELEQLYNLGWRGALFFVDDNFIGNRAKVKSLLRDIAKWQKARDYPFDLFTEASVDMADDEELMNLMSNAGFNMVFLGIETPVEETLISAGKKQNVKQNLRDSVEKILRKGIEVTGGFIVGFDTDPPDIFERQIRFIQESGIVQAMVGLLTALPGTQLYHRLEREGRLLADSTGNNTHDLQVNFKTNMELTTLLGGYKRIIAHIYRPKNYFDRCLTFLKYFRPHHHSVRKVRRKELYELYMSLSRQAFSSYGHYYLYFLARALIRNWRMFPEAVRLAIIGHHFFIITRQILAVDDFKKNVNDLIAELRVKYADAQQEVREEILKRKKELLLTWKKKMLKIDENFRFLAEEALKSLEEYFDSLLSRFTVGTTPSLSN